MTVTPSYLRGLAKQVEDLYYMLFARFAVKNRSLDIEVVTALRAAAEQIENAERNHG